MDDFLISLPWRRPDGCGIMARTLRQGRKKLLTLGSILGLLLAQASAGAAEEVLILQASGRTSARPSIPLDHSLFQPTTVVPAGRVFFRLTSPVAGRRLTPGQTVPWAIDLFATGPNLGLALFSVDLRQDVANPEMFDLSPGDGAPQAMAAFDRPLGFTNPAADPYGSGYGGLSRRLNGSHRELLQIGGSQNTFGIPGPCFGPDADICHGQATEVVPLVARRGPTTVATGSFTLPATPGLYTFYLDGARANVLAGRWHQTGIGVRPARVETRGAWFSVRVDGPPPHGKKPMVLRPPADDPAPYTDAVARPAEGSSIPYIHVPFRWPAPNGATGGYLLQVVEDGGAPDPFAAAGPDLLELLAPGPEPRLVVTEGLEFGRAYAWRVAPIAAGQEGLAAATVRRFRTLPLPPLSFSMVTSEPQTGPVQPGVTLFNVGRMQDPPGSSGPLALAVDRDGEPVYFTFDSGVGNMGYVEVRPETGRLLMNKAAQPGPGGGTSGPPILVVNEETLDGRLAWQAPNDQGYRFHHDADLMPNGNAVLLLYDDLLLPEDGGRTRISDRIVILDRHTREEIWSWAAIDHYSILDGDRFPDWTHGNAANYHTADDSIYFSSRHLSRITRIDVATGQVVYNMGAAQPSGDTDFGAGLFTFQHAPEILPNGNMVLFDNGNLSSPQVSRAMEIRFNSNSMPTHGEIVWEWVERDDLGMPLFSAFAGDADRQPNGNTVLSSAPRATIYEVTPDKRLVWKLRVVGPTVSSIYRIQRLPALHLDTPGDRDADQDVDLLDLAGPRSGSTAVGRTTSPGRGPARGSRRPVPHRSPRRRSSVFRTRPSTR
jgi:hypothetical protein